MIDPNTSPLRATPKDNRDLMVTSGNSWTLAFDNLSYLPPWLSDTFCRLSTGGGAATRALYTDTDEILFDGQRPIFVNGIEELATRTDLLDRSILLELKPIDRYRAEREFWAKFEDARPLLLGALLDVAVDSLRKVATVNLTEKPRMADFATLATAAEPALGLRAGAFTKAYDRNRKAANAVALEASPIASLTCELAERRPWEGSADELLKTLTKMADKATARRQSFPKSTNGLSGMLRRLSRALKTAGIDVEFSRDKSLKRNRIISIKKRVTALKKPKEE